MLLISYVWYEWVIWLISFGESEVKSFKLSTTHKIETWSFQYRATKLIWIFEFSFRETLYRNHDEIMSLLRWKVFLTRYICYFVKICQKWFTSQLHTYGNILFYINIHLTKILPTHIIIALSYYVARLLSSKPFCVIFVPRTRTKLGTICFVHPLQTLFATTWPIPQMGPQPRYCNTNFKWWVEEIKWQHAWKIFY